MSKFQRYFNAEASALLALGVYEQFPFMDDLNDAADGNIALKDTLEKALELQLLLQSNIDDHERNGAGYPTSFSVCPDSGDGFYTRDQLKVFVEPMNVEGLLENIDKQTKLALEKPLGKRQKETLLRIIGALTLALVDHGPQNLKKKGRPLVGEEGSGIVGLIKKKEYIKLSDSTLQGHISGGIRAIEDFKKQ